MTDWNKIQEEYKTTELSMKALADKYNVKASTLRSRKNREGWTKGNETTQRNEKKNVATQKKNDATQKAIEQLEQNDELNDKQKQFCLLYLKYFNATKAYREVYGVGQKTAEANGSRLLSNAKVKEELSRLKRAQQKELYIDSTDIKREWMKQAFSDVTDFMEFGHEEYTYTDEITGEQEERIRSFVRLRDHEEVDGTLVQEVKQGRDGVSVKLYDKQKAMDRLMDFLKDTDGSDSDKVFIIDNSGDERMQKWVEDNGGL